jgi:hypothetical protein
MQANVSEVRMLGDGCDPRWLCYGWRPGQRVAQVRLRRTRQQQSPARTTASPVKISVSYHWNGQ